jgi:hypothetical protein
MPIYPKQGKNFRTVDPTTWITKIETSPAFRLSYENSDGDAWWIAGTCNACGACEVNGDGSITREGTTKVEGKEIGEPGASFDANYETRLDIPIRPNLVWENRANGCVLSGEYTRTTRYTPPDTR